MFEIQLNNLSTNQTECNDKIESAISKVLKSGWYIFGPEHDALENDLSKYLGVKHVINVANGTDALQIALNAIGVAKGDYVITAANAGGYSSIAILQLGAIPVYCDVSEDTHMISPESLEKCLTNLDVSPKAIIVTHLYGAVAPIMEISAIAKISGMLVVEDCAQSLGASLGGKFTGSLGDIAATSFYPTKNLGAIGDGGAVLTNNADYASNARMLRQYGWGKKYDISYPGGRNSRMDELQAAILRVKLTYLDEWNNKRREIHSKYENSLSNSAQTKMLNSSARPFVAHLAVVKSPNVERARELLHSHGIQTEVHYPIPDHKQKAFTGKFLSTDLSVTESITNTIFSVPIFPQMTENEIRKVCMGLKEV